jgi:hypothetical protein
LANISVGAKHDRSEYEIITNNLSAVMLLQASKVRCTPADGDMSDAIKTECKTFMSWVYLYLARAKHFGIKFISENQKFTAEMLRPYGYICKNGMHPMSSIAFFDAGNVKNYNATHPR